MGRHGWPSSRWKRPHMHMRPCRLRIAFSKLSLCVAFPTAPLHSGGLPEGMWKLKKLSRLILRSGQACSVSGRVLDPGGLFSSNAGFFSCDIQRTNMRCVTYDPSEVFERIQQKKQERRAIKDELQQQQRVESESDIPLAPAVPVAAAAAAAGSPTPTTPTPLQTRETGD